MHVIKYVYFLKYLRYFDLSKESFNSSVILTFCFGRLASILRLRSSSLMEFMSKGNLEKKQVNKFKIKTDYYNFIYRIHSL